TFTAPTNIPIQVSASVTNGVVDFYVVSATGTVKIGTDSTSPYSFIWTNSVGGNYTLRAYLTDSAGRVGLPSSVNIIINDKPVANPDYMAVLKNTGSEWLDVLANDTDANGDGLTITNVSSAGWG